MPQDLSIELLNKKIQIVQKFEEKYCLDDVPALIIGNQVWPTTFTDLMIYYTTYNL